MKCVKKENNMELCQFMESEYQSLIEFMLIDEFANHMPFEIVYHEGTDENKRGYDLEVRSLIPLFFQFKVSNYYPMFSKSPLTKSRKEALNFSDNPGHFTFHLHLDKKTKTYLQHNLIYELSQNGNYARYVAPLFYQRNTLNKYKYRRPDLKWDIYHHFLMDDIDYYGWRDYLYLPGSVTIRPHRVVQGNAPHNYSYNSRGEISFHSEPEKIEQETVSLGSYLSYVVNQSVNGKGLKFRDIVLSVLKSILYVGDQAEGQPTIYYSLERANISVQTLKAMSEKIDSVSFSDLFDLFSKLSKYLLREHRIIAILGTIER